MDGTGQGAAAVFAAIEGLLDGLDVSTVARGSRLACAALARRLSSRLQAVAGLLLAEADATKEGARDAGTPTTTLLTVAEGLSRREAAAALHQAQELREHAVVGRAAASGRISIGQARAIHTVLNGLDGLDDAQRGHAEAYLLTLAEQLDSDRLAKAGPQVLAEVAPERADERLERRLEREAAVARRSRSLVFGSEAGSVTFRGSLPKVDGENLIRLIEAHAESARRHGLDQADPLSAMPSAAQRRADALVALVAAHQAAALAPSLGGDRPRLVVTLDFERLRAGAVGAGLIGDRDPVDAGTLRRLCCDGDLLPMVLGSASEPLDVGQQVRLVTPAMRAALALRDGGCVFPGCSVRPELCEAHHVVPWHRGGPTALHNLVLLCPHHHGLVEPARDGPRDQWEIRIADDGLPEVVPPARFDRHRRPRRHSRLTDGRGSRGGEKLPRAG
jgi:hypothetical protein